MSKIEHQNIIYFKTAATQFPSSPLWGWHFVVPNDIAIQFVDGKDRRVVCTINDKLTIHAALMPNKETWFVMLNQKHVKLLQIVPDTIVEVQMVKDTSEFGMPFPEELKEVLYQDVEAEKYFMSLTPGKQRTLIYQINNTKNSDGRIRKSLAIADHLTANHGAIDYKLLNEAFKAYNKM
ncbi:MAG: YdeI/OmpD-associated family protein [Saprospiraceae bacterium]|jgi:hypothetical protein